MWWAQGILLPLAPHLLPLNSSMEDFYYRKLKVYQQSKTMANEVYEIVKQFPRDDQNILANQLLRSSLSVPSNIAEGMGRFSKKERVHFLEIALGSLMEAMCQLEIAESRGYIGFDQFTNQENNFKEISRMIVGLKKSLEE